MVDVLNEAIENHNLTDLHTHLLGMGSPSFWIDEIMGKVLPSMAKARKVEKWPSDVVEKRISLTSCGEAYAECLKSQRSSSIADDDTTFDVVYSIQSLCKALRIYNKEKSDAVLLNQLFNNLGQPSDLQSFKRLFGEHSVWNARLQKQEVRTGITNSALNRLIQTNETVRSHIEGCFEMKECGESRAKGTSIERRYQGHFTPEFYPGRYALKDDMYSQYPAVLDKLLNHVLKQYWESGVRYVEFSVGVGDVMRPWIWNHLVKPELNEDVKNLKGLRWRYLAGFGRNETLKLEDPNQLPSASTIVNHFTKHFDDLRALEKIIDQCREYSDALGGFGVHQHCVGLDYFGDEEAYPYCPFGQDQFLQFLKKERNTRKASFGFRYHCGECDRPEPDRYLTAHMEISSQVICDILRFVEQEKLGSSDGQCPPLRIGHGIAFKHWIGLNDLPKNPTIVEAIAAMKKHNIPIEINITSNYYLSWQEYGRIALNTFLNYRIRVVICTDNHGIWPCESKVDDQVRYRSVASEIYSAILDHTADDTFTQDHLHRLINYGKKAVFDAIAFST